MNLKEFVRSVLVDINAAVDEATGLTAREIRFSEKDNARTIEFDIAVTAETKDKANGKTSLRVLELADAGAELGKEGRNSTVSRIVFGLSIDSSTREERERSKVVRTARRQSSIHRRY